MRIHWNIETCKVRVLQLNFVYLRHSKNFISKKNKQHFTCNDYNVFQNWFIIQQRNSIFSKHVSAFQPSVFETWIHIQFQLVFKCTKKLQNVRGACSIFIQSSYLPLPKPFCIQQMYLNIISIPSIYLSSNCTFLWFVITKKK